MEWKNLFRPTIAKIVLLAALMGGINYFLISTTYVLDATMLAGFPLGFWPIGSVYLRLGQTTQGALGFSWLNFMIDIAFWYVISCFVASPFERMGRTVSKKREQQA